MANLVSKLRQNILFAASGAMLAVSTFAVAPAEAFTVSLNPDLCPIPSDCTTDDYHGSTAALDFSFEDNPYGVLIDLKITNTTPTPLGSTLVGVAFELPDFVTAYTYDRGTSAYRKLFRNADLHPFDRTFDIGIRSIEDSQGSINNSRRIDTFAGGKAKGGLLAGESTTVGFILNTGSLDAATVAKQVYQAYMSNDLRAAGRFQEVGPNQTEGDNVLGIIRQTPTPPRDVPEPTLLLGLGAIAGILARSRRQ